MKIVIYYNRENDFSELFQSFSGKEKNCRCYKEMNIRRCRLALELCVHNLVMNGFVNRIKVA